MKEERMLIQIVAEQPESVQTPQQWYKYLYMYKL